MADQQTTDDGGQQAARRAGSDPVNRPAHYTFGGIECIDAIEAALGREGFIAFLRGQVIKYQWRLGHKGPAGEDAEKANWYGKRLTKTLKKQ